MRRLMQCLLLAAALTVQAASAWPKTDQAGLPPHIVECNSFALDSSGVPVPYIAYHNSGKTSVMRFNGTDWEQVGKADHISLAA